MSKAKTMVIHCCACGGNVNARLTDGSEIYPHRPDLYALPFWRCDNCRNFVGCHHKTQQRTRPLGCIPTQEMKGVRMRIHALIDPLWKSGAISRRAIYSVLTEVLGREYHTGELRTMEEAQKVLRAAHEIRGAA